MSLRLVLFVVVGHHATSWPLTSLEQHPSTRPGLLVSPAARSPPAALRRLAPPPRGGFLDMQLAFSFL